MKYKNQIIKALSKVTGLTEAEVKLDIPENSEHGDYSSNIALQNASPITDHRSPRERAEELVKLLKSDKSLAKVVDKIEIAGPGFINFFLKKEALLDTLVNISSQKFTDRYGQSLKGKKIVVEFTDPNPFKEFHVGHLYSNTVGESISRLLESQGAEVWRADYFGDVGMHVAKAIWGLLAKFAEDKLSMIDLARRGLKERIEYMGQAYAKGATAYEEDELAKEDMKILNFLIFKSAQEVVLPQFKEDPQVNYDQYIKPGKYDYLKIRNIYETGRDWSMEYFESIYRRLGMEFDGYYPESRTGEFGYGMVLAGLEQGIFERGEKGAVIFPGEKYGLHNRVFINAMNLPTYEAKDFGNAVAKHKDFAYDKSIIVTGNEINEYFVVVLKALSMYRKELSEATNHIGHGMVRLPEGKMSSRTGKIIRGEWVLDETKKKEMEVMGENADEEIGEIVAQGAVKYAFLKQGIGKDIIFDFDTSLSLEGNSGPYLQYTYARTQSVLAKAQRAKGKGQIYTLKGASLQGSNSTIQQFNNEELNVLRTLVHFPEVVSEAAEKYAPNLICNYIYDLAQKFNSFYARHKILDTNSERIGSEAGNEAKHKIIENVNTEHGTLKTTQAFRLELTSATGIVLKEGLRLLGIQTPNKM